MPTPADLSLRAGDLLAIEVDVEIVSVEAFVAAVLAGGIAQQRPGHSDPAFSGGAFQVDQRGVTTVNEVLGGQQATTLQTGMDARQGLRIARRGRGGGHVRDHVRILG